MVIPRSCSRGRVKEPAQKRMRMRQARPVIDQEVQIALLQLQTNNRPAVCSSIDLERP